MTYIINRFYSETNRVMTEDFKILRNVWSDDSKQENFSDWLKLKDITFTKLMSEANTPYINAIIFKSEAEFLAFKLKYL